MRVSPETSQVRIGETASEEWGVSVQFWKKFPSILESNGGCQMVKFPVPVRDTDDPPPAPDCEEEMTGLKLVPHRPMAMSYTRSGSADDLRALAGMVIVICSSLEPQAVEAVIHFGNQEWAGKVNCLCTADRLVREAQVQLGIEGERRVRSAITLCKVRTIEAEKVEIDQEHEVLPRDAEVTLDYHGTKKTVQLKAGADVWNQAKQHRQRLERLYVAILSKKREILIRFRCSGHPSSQ
jgi:hypothetical protein